MKIGMLAVLNEHSVDPATFARRAEALGFESIWLPDHPVMPAHTSTPLPETPPGKGEIPEHYSRMCDPFVAMAMAAGATTRLMVGTGVCLVPERNPMLTAKEVATLDAFSNGRVLFGIGAGWLKEESELLGADYPHRWTQTREYIARCGNCGRKTKPLSMAATSNSRPCGFIQNRPVRADRRC